MAIVMRAMFFCVDLLTRHGFRSPCLDESVMRSDMIASIYEVDGISMYASKDLWAEKINPFRNRCHEGS